jgi:peroxiredoxin (alkyl hydroperoxide reductase subunit C)
VIVPPPNTQEMAEERVKQPNLDCKDWFFCMKKMP